MSGRQSTPTASKEERAARALARSEVYLFLARSLAYPRSALEEFHTHALEATAILEGEVRKLVTDLEVPTLEEVERQYIRAFGHATPRNYPPYEAEYGQSNIFIQGHTLAQISAFYRAFGMEAARGERLDHLGTELEFMYFLVYKEAYALVSAQEEQAELCRQGQRRFLEKHLGCWAPLCLQMLSQQVDGFYCQLSQVAISWLRAEMKELGVPPLSLGEEALANSGQGEPLPWSDYEPAPCEERP